MCSEDIQLQNIREAIHLQEGRFERNGNLEALLHILTANRTNGLWRMIRKEYLRAACTFDKTNISWRTFRKRTRDMKFLPCMPWRLGNGSRGSVWIPIYTLQPRL